MVCVVFCKRNATEKDILNLYFFFSLKDSKQEWEKVDTCRLGYKVSKIVKRRTMHDLLIIQGLYSIHLVDLFIISLFQLRNLICRRSLEKNKNYITLTEKSEKYISGTICLNCESAPQILPCHVVFMDSACIIYRYYHLFF